MPRPVKAFACEWGCKRHCTTSRTAMTRHEAECKKNPASRACATCKHEGWEPYESDTGTVGGPYCFDEETGDSYLPEGKLMKRNCEHWQAREESK